ncbi:thioredoxin fold domain-containing protein [candidate division KSB1 bacterium]|nr:thioredoxin fold domain-containing protein [candidate division KSB1 bacterium]
MKIRKISILSCLILVMSCQSADEAKMQPEKSENSDALITFVELGSVNCVPCKAMQPVMESIEKKYGDQIKVVFYDVWQPDQKKFAQEYKIKLIPTQVFLDKDGNEIMRHEGFFPEKEIDVFLQKQGLKILQNQDQV